MGTGVSTADVIQTFIDNALAETHVSLPARVISYDPETQNANVQPMLNKQYSDGEIFERATIQDVPVIWPSNRNSMLTMPMNVGDIVLLLFTDKSIDRWRYSDGEILVTPDDRRFHDYSDAVAIPGVYPFTAAPNNSARFTVNEGTYADVILKHNIGEANREVEIRLKEDGTFTINCANGITIKVNPDGTTSATNDTGELIDLLTQCLQAISDTTVNTVYGTSPLNNKPAIDALIVQLETFKE